MNLLAKYGIAMCMVILATACTEKKETPKDSPKIIITESNTKTDEPVQIPMHGTND